MATDVARAKARIMDVLTEQGGDADAASVLAQVSGTERGRNVVTGLSGVEALVAQGGEIEVSALVELIDERRVSLRPYTNAWTYLIASSITFDNADVVTPGLPMADMLCLLKEHYPGGSAFEARRALVMPMLMVLREDPASRIDKNDYVVVWQPSAFHTDERRAFMTRSDWPVDTNEWKRLPAHLRAVEVAV